MKIAIHEFSTGINYETLPNGDWVSKGFTGHYINSTLEEIPKTVERAIANKLFDVAEGAGRDQPAIIGRVIPGDNIYPDYSLIAIVTKGKDDTGRNPRFSRYFLCEGADSLWKLIEYLEEYKRLQNKIPSFNPLETRKPGQGIPYELKRQKPNFPVPNEYISATLPMLLDQEINCHKINIWAEANAQRKNQLVSWAYNVEALETSQHFIIIKPASEIAYQAIQEDIKVKASKITFNPTFDEQGIKNAVKGLMNHSQVKPEWLNTINDCLAPGKVSEAYWEKLFNNEGADRGIKGEIASEPMARLLTLRAIILPKTLPVFLAWFNDQKQLQKYSLNLQQNLKPLVQHNLDLQVKLKEDLKEIISLLLRQKIKCSDLAEFLKNNSCIWKLAFDNLAADIDQDLQKIANSQTNLTCPFNQQLLTYTSDKKTLTKYEPLAELLGELRQYKLAAYYHQYSHNNVPKSLFNSAFPRLRTNKTDYAGIILYREPSPKEIIMNFVSKYQKPLLLSTIGLLSIGILVGTFYWGKNSANDELKAKLAEQQEKLNSCQQAQTTAPKQPPKSSVTNITKPSQSKQSNP